MGAVRIRHPDLDAEVEVAPSAVPHHVRSGWQPVDGQDVQGETWPEELQDQPQVRMRHPDLPQEITVPKGSVVSARAQGWVVVKEEAAPEPAPTQGRGRSRPSSKVSQAGGAGPANKEDEG